MDKNKKYWLDQPGNVNKIVYALYAACVALLLVEVWLLCLVWFSRLHQHCYECQIIPQADKTQRRLL